MGRPKKPTASPPPRDPLDAWGDVPVDHRSERKRLARIVARNGRGIANYRAFCLELWNACHDADRDLYERLGYNQTAVADDLNDFRQKFADARKALDDLGADAAKVLNEAVVEEHRDLQEYSVQKMADARKALDGLRADAAEALNEAVVEEPQDLSDDSIWTRLEPTYLTLFEPTWDDRREWVGRVLADCERWAEKACEAVGKPGRGRPKDNAASNLVRRLGELWEAQTGRRPTLITNAKNTKKSGDFLEFCEEVISPIWQNRGLSPPSVEDCVKVFLYPKKDKLD